MLLHHLLHCIVTMIASEVCHLSTWHLYLSTLSLHGVYAGDVWLHLKDFVIISSW